MLCIDIGPQSLLAQHFLKNLNALPFPPAGPSHLQTSLQVFGQIKKKSFSMNEKWVRCKINLSVSNEKNFK